ncbi:hypothetical protein FHW69_000509 [Luteibacter sp. Sphag1AF]|uniref:ribosomal maturation YjgA family protein n=1 Tax=Luteibacter sp. Sphag1AF TaxID=2587031 RepID=UPI0016197F7D|nr:DUF2809 domain-containing protein [Luteibacter sp. Sphag1AF]MBB3225919.1 hypothetical protein [Luteibacter sp. Sphag1AF]
MRHPRHRLVCAAAVLLTIAAGLASRRFPDALPAVLGKYPGDALWALMVYFGYGMLFPCASALRIAGLAMATSVAIECLKLWQEPWMVAVRHSTLGHLVFGHAFSWQNLLAYAIGVGMGLLIEVCVAARLAVKA